jgi:hypothetical protein
MRRLISKLQASAVALMILSRSICDRLLTMEHIVLDSSPASLPKIA